MQLCIAFIKPLKSYYSSEIQTFLRNVSQEESNRNKDLVTPFRVAKLFGAAYQEAATMEISMNDFRKTSLYPLNREVFRDYDFPIRNDEGLVNSRPLSPELVATVADIIPTVPSQETCRPIPGSSRIVSS